jgi:putative membrane protein
MELFRLTNLLYAFVRHAVRGQRHGYSDVGPVTVGLYTFNAVYP